MKSATFFMLVLAAAFVATPGASRAQEGAAALYETRAQVPALDEFHHVIRVIWHEAWPAKDAAKLRELLPEVEKGAKAIVDAKLPGILREKQGAWDEQVKTLQSVVALYAGAAAGADDKALLDAAEKLHAQYEAMVRLIRPPLPELEAFHVVLYQLYHSDLPAGDVKAMRATIDRMKDPLAALESAKLPEAWSKEQADRFDNARTKLVEATKELNKAAPKADAKALKAPIEKVHDRYLGVIAVCD
ncbi:MAG TPA: hypothetical protein VFS09_00695 [Candidatus Eisenbacteria bacterium]|nr:hypothetical protein [Candidatus Eisenbacteria bacterium]